MWIRPAAAALSVLASAHCARAADIDPDACFCLRHPSGQSQRGCRVEKFPGQYYQTAICRDPETGKTSETVTMVPTSPWTVVMEGAAGCEACGARARETPEVPRGEDAEPEEAAE